MSLVDLIGFVISLLAIIFLFFNSSYRNRMTEEERAELEKAENELPDEHPLKDFLQKLEGDINQEKIIPITQPNETKRDLKQAPEYKKLKVPPLRHSNHLKSPITKQVDKMQAVKKTAHVDSRQLIIHYEIMKKPRSWNMVWSQIHSNDFRQPK